MLKPYKLSDNFTIGRITISVRSEISARSFFRLSELHGNRQWKPAQDLIMAQAKMVLEC